MLRTLWSTTGYVRNYDGKVVVISPDTETFMPKLSEFEEKITPSTKAVIINNPNNPTGVVYSEEIIRSLAAILERKEKEFGISIVLISDEPYRGWSCIRWGPGAVYYQLLP